jgi:CheY-like chemotaxis protein
MRKKSILFVDDEPWYVKDMIEQLEEEGYQVIPAYDGTQALEALESGEFIDLVVLDIMMPTGERITDPFEGKRAGIKVGEFVRKEMKAKIPIVYLTVIWDQAVHNHIERIEKEAGLDACILVKPVLPGELVEKVNALVGKP